MVSRVKFSSQATSDLLSAMRSIAREEGRQFQAVLEDAMALYVESKRGDNPRPHVMDHLRASLIRNNSCYQDPWL